MSPSVTAPSKAFRLLPAGALALSALLVLPASAVGQDDPDQPPQPGSQAAAAQTRPEGETRAPAYIAAVDGLARLDRDGQSEAAERGVPLVPGDRLRTEGGRIELAFPNGTQVYLDRYTEVDLVDRLGVRVARGRLYVRVSSTIDADERVAIDGPGASIDFLDDGEYRIAVGGTDAAEVELVVLRGQAALSSEGGHVLVPQGHRSVARDSAAPSTPEWTNAGQTTLERWAADREAMWQSGQYASRQYLPAELGDYAATFDQHGTWQNDESHGAVWYPSSTTEDWRPYYDGRWDYTSHYGWTWIAGGPVWAYPTHHYGRWNLGARGWHWIPSRRWGAAWVYWAVAPGYVGWCPLGWNGRPVLSVFHYDRSYPSRWRDPYRAWTVIPRTSFGRAHVPGVHADRGRLVREQPAFVLQHRAPGFAPPRSPYPSPFNPRLNAGTRGSDRAPSRGGVSTMSPRSYGRYGSDRDSRGGHAVSRGTTSEDGSTSVSPYERARPYMPRPDTRATVDEGNVYRRVPADQAPARSPNGSWRARGDRDGGRNDNRDDDGRGGAGYAAPGYRVRESPGMSRPAERDRSPGMSDSHAGSRRAVPRDDPPARGDDDGGRATRSGSSRDSAPDRGASPRSSAGGDRSSGGDRGSSRGGDSGARGVSGGGAARRHP